MNEGITFNIIFASNVSPSPDYDLIMKEVIISFFTSAKTKHFTARITDDYYWKCLDAQSILFHFISGLEIAVTPFAEVSDQFVYLGTTNEILVDK